MKQEKMLIEYLNKAKHDYDVKKELRDIKQQRLEITKYELDTSLNEHNNKNSSSNSNSRKSSYHEINNNNNSHHQSLNTKIPDNINNNNNLNDSENSSEYILRTDG